MPGKPRPADPGHLSVNYFFPSGQTNLVWSDEAARRTPRLNRDNLLELARTAEDVGFDSLFIADNWSGHQREAERAGHQSPAFHAPLLAMGIFAVTDHIGVITTFHTTHHKPAHVARMGANLDAYSGGRWGWNCVTGHSQDEAALFGEAFIEHDLRYAMAAEFVEIVERLWAEEEPIDVDGKYYRVQGRIKAPRPAQRPRPLLVSAGASPAGTQFAAEWCDALVTLARDDAGLLAVHERVRALTAGNGRDVGTWPFCITLIRDGEGEAEEEFAHLLESLNVAATRELAADILGSIQTAAAMFEEQGEEEAARAFGSGGAEVHLIGTPEQVAEKIIGLKRNANASGVLLNFPLWSPQEIRGFERVLPYLREAGVWTPPADRDWSW
jgi:FMNH2-dependent dimethyl sulfone monooxygenase